MNGAGPLVSVIVATYNWSSVLRYALLSAQAQTFSDFELLVIGDGCTDDSADVVASLGEKRFKWENLPVNSGHQSAGNNRGLALARGEWIAYLGHDDLWMPNHLEQLLSRLDQTNADVAFSLAMLIGAPGCDGRMLFPVFDEGKYERGADIPPSALIHRRSLAKQYGNWPDHRITKGPPESTLLTRFYDNGAKFTSLAEVTVFKFPSSWRPFCYPTRSCKEQAAFFLRLQHEPDFLHRELIELATATQLLKPHTRIPATSVEDNLRPGAVIEEYRRARGLTSETPEENPPRYVVTATMARLIDRLTNEEIERRQVSRFAIFEVFWAQNGGYSAANSKRTVIPMGQWSRIRIPLEHASDGAPLRIDPCERPALIELAGISLRRDGRVDWSLRGKALDSIACGGDAFCIKRDRVLTVRSRGNDPNLFLPGDLNTDPPFVLKCWIRINPSEARAGSASWERPGVNDE